MTTVQDVWGFDSFLAVDLTGTLGARFLAAMHAAALDRGIKPDVPSDALDASRVCIMDDAAQAVGADWEVVDNTLRLWPRGVTLDWNKVAEAAS